MENCSISASIKFRDELSEPSHETAGERQARVRIGTKVGFPAFADILERVVHGRQHKFLRVGASMCKRREIFLADLHVPTPPHDERSQLQAPQHLGGVYAHYGYEERLHAWSKQGQETGVDVLHRATG